MPFRSSILLKSVAAVLLALAVSTAVTAVTFSRLTRSALDEQSNELGRGQMSIMQEAYSTRQRQLLVNLRNLTQNLVAQGLFSPDRRPDLIAELGRVGANLELDLLTVVDGKGRLLSPPVTVGLALAAPEVVPKMVDDGLRSRLVRVSDGTFVQAAAVPLPSGIDGFVVVGGYSFDDEFAYSLRRQVGSHDDVLLVASGRVVGSTLPLPPARPPTLEGRDGLPTSPARVERADFRGLISYVPLGRTTDPEGGAIGLVLSDPAALLEGSLARGRLLATVALALVTVGLGLLLYRRVIRPVVELSGTATRIAGGDLGATFSAGGHDEIGTLATSLEHMRVELQTKLDLIARQAGDLQRQTTELQESSQRIVTAEDDERHRLARDLHDGIQQELVVLRMRIGMAAETAAQAGGDIPAPAGAETPARAGGAGNAAEAGGAGIAGQAGGAGIAAEFEQLGADLDGAIERMREVTRNLYPSLLLDRGLAVAIRSYIRRLPLNVRLTYASEPFPRLHPAIESGAYFLLCEALTNAIKHAGCSEVAIALRVDADRLQVHVQDDGRGFRPEEVRGRGGLLHMHDRVRSFGGELDVVSAPAHGTVIWARFPVRLPDEAAAYLPERGDAPVSPPPAPERTGLPRPAG